MDFLNEICSETDTITDLYTELKKNVENETNTDATNTDETNIDETNIDGTNFETETKKQIPIEEWNNEFKESSYTETKQTEKKVYDRIYDLFVNKIEIPIEEWNNETGMNVSLNDTIEIDKLNSLFGEERGYISLHNKKYDVEVEKVQSNRFYIYTQKVKETKNKIYVVISDVSYSSNNINAIAE